MKSLKLVFLFLMLSYSNMNLSQKYDLKNLMGINDSHIVGDTIRLEQNTLIAFNKMHEAALEDGIDIKIVSGFRDFERQMLIWNNKYKKYTTEYKLSPTKAIEEIIRFSTIPGTSRHHWGTDIDIIDGKKPKEGDLLLEEKFHENGPYVRLREWMEKNANRFGFYLPYTDSPKRKGFNYEPWHYSFAPLSIPMLEEYLKLDLINLLVPKDLNGENSIDEKFLESYIDENVLGINPKLKDF